MHQNCVKIAVFCSFRLGYPVEDHIGTISTKFLLWVNLDFIHRNKTCQKQISFFKISHKPKENLMLSKCHFIKVMITQLSFHLTKSLTVFKIPIVTLLILDTQ